MQDAIYKLTVKYSCGHEWTADRGPGVSDWRNCICNHCQPWDGILTTAGKCIKCDPDGRGIFHRSDPQEKVLDRQATLW